MKVLVIGGTLYFGKVIVRKLLERGDEVTIFSRGNTRPDFWDDVDHIQGDRNERDDFVDKLKDKEFDAVVDNLAFKVEDAKAVVKALQGRTGKYLVASTVSIYGAAGHFNEWRTLATQDRPTYMDEYIDLYAQGKRQIERYLSETPDFPSVGAAGAGDPGAGRPVAALLVVPSTDTGRARDHYAGRGLQRLPHRLQGRRGPGVHRRHGLPQHRKPDVQHLSG